MTYQIAYADEKVISVCRNLYVSSEGEAHPAVFLLSEQFDAVTGESWTSPTSSPTPTPYGRGWWTPCWTSGASWPRRWSRGRSPGTPSPPAVQVDNFYCTAEGYVFWLQGGACPP